MATSTVSAWAKPGAWALDSEEHEEEIIQQEKEKQQNGNNHFEQKPLSDFPTLSAAVTTKSKKKKPVSLSLAEFTTGKFVSHGSARAAAQATKGLTTDEILVLPTGPRERSAEELERSSTRLGGGFRSYGSRDRDDSSSNNRWGSDESRNRGGGGGGGFNRENNREPSGPSRADETDDWGAAKKSMGGSSFERRERGGGGGGGFFDSQSRADDSDSWVSNKTRVSSTMPPPRRVGGGFDNPRERRGGFEFQKESMNGGGADSDTWGKKKEEGTTTGTVVGARPKLVLQPRTVSPSNGEQQQQQQPGSGSGTNSVVKSNPFGQARPREEVLAEKGQDWKKIDEKLESVKIQETLPEESDGSSFGKKSFGNGNGRFSSTEARTERSWRKPESAEVRPPTPSSAEIATEEIGVENGVAAEN